MLYEMRRKDRLLDKKDALDILSSGEYGVLSTIGSDGYPYGVPVNYVYADGFIYFHCAANEGHKIDNMNFDSRVCFTVVSEHSVVPEKFTSKYKSVVAFGRVRLLNAEEKNTALLNIVEKYAPAFKANGARLIESNCPAAVYGIEIENIAGKANK